MHIEGLNTPPHEHREYPKVLYAGGDLKGETRVVKHIGQEDEARAEGFLAAGEEVAPEPEAPKIAKRR